jgi:GNAT superfamily N-acetyltransferase
MTTIRRAHLDDVRAIAECHVASWRDSYRPQISEEILANLSIEEYVAKWTYRIGEKDRHVLAAESESAGIVGLLYGGRERTGHADFRGEIYAMYVLTDFRRQGIGRKLFQHFVGVLLSQWIGSLTVWAFEENPCRAAYAAWGGELVGRETIMVGEQELVEVGYGWRDLRAIASAEGD